MVIQELRPYQRPSRAVSLDALVIVWPDEREGWGQPASPDELDALLNFYDLTRPENETEAATVIGNPFIAHIAPLEQGYRLTVQRQPQNDVQAAAWRLATATTMYQIIRQDQTVGVWFCDENQFIPFERLVWDAGRHKLRILED